MFSLSFFGGFTTQRRALLATTDFADRPFLPDVDRELALLADPEQAPPLAPRSPWHLFWLALRTIRGVVLRSIGWRIVSALVVLGGVFFAKELLSPDQPLGVLLALAGAFLVSRIVDAAIEYFDVMRHAQINRAVQVMLLRGLNRRLLTLDPVAAIAISKGELKTLVSSDVEAVEDFVSAAVRQWIPCLVMLILLGPALWWVTGVVGLVGLAAALLCVPSAIVGARFIERFQVRAQREQDELTRIVGEWVKNIRVVRFLGWQSWFTTQIMDRMRRFTWRYAARHLVVCTVYGITHVWWIIPIIAMVSFARGFGYELALPELFAAIWILDRLMDWLSHIPYSLSMYGAAVGSTHRLLALLHARGLEESLARSTNSPGQGAVPVAIELHDVTLSFGEKRVLAGVSLRLDLSARTAIIGSVGGGKTMLLELLAGERPPTSGRISVSFSDGFVGDLWQERVYNHYRDCVAYAAQQPFLSNATVHANIDLSTTRLRDAVVAAASAAQLANDVRIFSGGYDAEVGETGINLSGGQRQRVSLARAFISRRPILLLDDPLSAVDPATERHLMNRFLDTAQGLVLISHRLREILRCDRIIVLEQGRVVEDGAPGTLLANPHSHLNRFRLEVNHE